MCPKHIWNSQRNLVNIFFYQKKKNTKIPLKFAIFFRVGLPFPNLLLYKESLGWINTVNLKEIFSWKRGTFICPFLKFQNFPLKGDGNGREGRGGWISDIRYLKFFIFEEGILKEFIFNYFPELIYKCTYYFIFCQSYLLLRMPSRKETLSWKIL